MTKVAAEKKKAFREEVKKNNHTMRVVDLSYDRETIDAYIAGWDMCDEQYVAREVRHERIS